MSRMTDRIDRYQRRHRVVSIPIAIFYKFFDDQGNYLAAMVAYYAFIAIFPLLLLGSSILGFVLQGDAELSQQIFDSALSQFPIIGDQLQQPEGLQGSGWAVVIGAIGAIYGTLGLAQAGQNTINTAWAVPRNSRPNPFLARARSLLLLTLAGLAVLVLAAATTIGNNPGLVGIDASSGPTRFISAASVVLNVLVFAVLFKIASAYQHRFLAAVPGAITVALLWLVLQHVGSLYVSGVVQGATSLNATFAFVLGLIALLYLAALTLIFGIEVNVVLTKRLYPRALLTPFTDNVDLTEADKRAYTEYARAQRHKGFEVVDVKFRTRPAVVVEDDGAPVATTVPGEDPATGSVVRVAGEATATRPLAEPVVPEVAGPPTPVDPAAAAVPPR